MSQKATEHSETDLHRQAWEKARQLKEPFSWEDLRRYAGIGIVLAQQLVSRWEIEGRTKRFYEGRGPHRFLAVENFDAYHADGDAPLPIASAEGNMWRSIRRLQGFSALDIALHATAGGIEVSEADAKTYLTALMKAGYLSVHRKADPSSSTKARYRLAKDTGPDAPRRRRVVILWDPNEEIPHLLNAVPS